MKNFFNKYAIAIIVGFVLVGAGAFYLINEIFDEDHAVVTSSSQKVSNAQSNTAASGKVIGQEKVKAIVEKTVGKDKLTYASIILKTDDGVQEYDVKATADGTVYDLEIDALSGQVISSEQEAVSNQSNTTAANSSVSIDEAEVKKIVEKASGKSNLTYTQIQLGQDDDYNGTLVYDVTAYADGVEYDYDIDAESGDILSQSSESGDD